MPSWLPSKYVAQPREAGSLYVPSGELFNPACSSLVGAQNPFVIAPTGRGMVWQGLQNTVRYGYLKTDLNGKWAVTYFVLLNVKSGISNHQGVIGTRSTTADLGYIQITRQSSNVWNAACKVQNGDTETNDVSQSVSLGWNFLSFTVGADCRFYVNGGAPVVFNRSSNNPFSGQQRLCFGAYYDGTSPAFTLDRQLNADIAGIAVIPNYVASIREVREAQNNFWSIVRTPARPVFFGAAAATTFIPIIGRGPGLQLVGGRGLAG